MSHIEHQAAYDRAIKRNILNNANKTWFAATPRHQEILDALCAGRSHPDDRNPDRVEYSDNFIGSIAKAFDSFGKLSVNQSAAVLKGIDARVARKAEWADKAAVLNSTRTHIGTVGEKVTLTLTVVHVVVMEGVYGTSFFNICEDADKNVVIYKGNAQGFPNKGETATVTASVKEHGVREGVKQTIIQRPKVK